MTTPAMRIVEITRERFPEWKRMRQALFSDLTPEFHDEEMEWIFHSREAACFFALSETDEPIGLLELSLRNFVDGCIGGPVGYIEGIYLAPTCRGQGLGGRLVAFAADWFKARGCADMATDAEIDNIEAQEFYRRIGFKETWRIVGFTRSLQERSA